MDEPYVRGNEVAKLYADNKVDVIIYTVEKSLDSYKFNLLHNKQLFIEQLKNNRMGSRTIDEGSMDEKSGMIFSEYVAILSGNTDLLEKAKLEKKIAGLDSERQAFIRSKSSSRSRADGGRQQGVYCPFPKCLGLVPKPCAERQGGKHPQSDNAQRGGRKRPETHRCQTRGNQRESLHTGRVFQYRNTLRI